MPARVDFEFLEECVVPQVLHVVPFLDDAVLHWIADLQHGAGRRRFVAAHNVLDHHIRAAFLFGTEDWSANDGGVLEFGEVLCGIADFEEAGAAIEHCEVEPIVSAQIYFYCHSVSYQWEVEMPCCRSLGSQ